MDISHGSDHGLDWDRQSEPEEEAMDRESELVEEDWDRDSEVVEEDWDTDYEVLEDGWDSESEPDVLVESWESDDTRDNDHAVEEVDEFDFGPNDDEWEESSVEEQYWSDVDDLNGNGQHKGVNGSAPCKNEQGKCGEHAGQTGNEGKVKCENDDSGAAKEKENGADGSREHIPGEPINGPAITEQMLINLNVDVVSRLEFRTLKDGANFFHRYGMANGFGIRTGSKKNDNNGEIVWQALSCNKKGFRMDKWLNLEGRRKTAERISRCGCTARCTIKLDRERLTFKFGIFEMEHNHDLSLDTEVPYFRSNRKVTQADVDTVMTMKESGIGISQIYAYMVNSRGGARFVGFLTKDLYNRASAEHRLRNLAGDAETMIQQMRDRKHEDPGFKCFYGLDPEGRLGSVIWRDSKSVEDYYRFNDTIVFDSTYKTNMYGKPLVLFLGANHHRATVVFACAILIDETAESYCWVLKAFKSLMNGIAPKCVLTDGDESMHKAVVEEFPEATHRLCSWHVSRNITERIKDKDIVKDFMNLLYNPMSVDSFDRRWDIMVGKIQNGGARESVMAWLNTMYQKRDRWAQAFFAGNFLRPL